MKINDQLLDRQVIGVNDLVTTQRERIEIAHGTLLRKAEKLGEQDGTLNLPATEDQQVSPHENLIQHEYQKLIADSWNIGKPYLDAPHLEYHATIEQLEDLNENEESILQKERELADIRETSQLEEIRQTYEGRERELEQHENIIKRDYLQAKQELHDEQIAAGRTSPQIHFKSKFWYIMLLIGIGICEVPLNLQIFQKFGEAFFITIIMASSLAISIPVLAHFTGVFLKQRKDKREYLGFALACIFLFAIFNFGVSIFRAYVLAENVAQNSDNLNIVIFTSLNLILFVIGVLAAYFRHDENYDLENAHYRFLREKKKYDKQKLKIENSQKLLANEKNARINEVKREYTESISQINRRKQNLIQKKNKSAQVYDELLNSFKGLEDLVEANYRISISRYRAGNLKFRSNQLSPASWAKPITRLSKRFEDYQELDPNGTLNRLELVPSLNKEASNGEASEPIKLVANS